MPVKTDTLPHLLTVGEVATILHVSRAKLYTMLDRGEILNLRVGGCRRIPAAAVEQYLADRIAAEERPVRRRK